jgi:hypothetical protein
LLRADASSYIGNILVQEAGQGGGGNTAPMSPLLYDTDFAVLGSDPTSHCLLWLADIEVAIATSQLALTGTLTPEALIYFSSIISTRLTPASTLTSP